MSFSGEGVNEGEVPVPCASKQSDRLCPAQALQAILEQSQWLVVTGGWKRFFTARFRCSEGQEKCQIRVLSDERLQGQLQSCHDEY